MQEYKYLSNENRVIYHLQHMVKLMDRRITALEKIAESLEKLVKEKNQ